MTAPGREVAGRLLRGEVRSPDPEAFGEEALARAEVQRQGVAPAPGRSLGCTTRDQHGHVDVIAAVRIGPAGPTPSPSPSPSPPPRTVCQAWASTRNRSRNPTRDGASPGRPVPDREPGKHEKK